MKNLFINHRSMHTDLGILLLRLIFGGMFMYVGYLKISAYNQMLSMMGDPIGIGTELSLILVIFAELFCGFFVAVGFLTRLTVIPILVVMIVVLFVVHIKDQFVMIQLPFVYWLLCFVIFIFGSGRFSLDYYLFSRKSRLEEN